MHDVMAHNLTRQWRVPWTISMNVARRVVDPGVVRVTFRGK